MRRSFLLPALLFLLGACLFPAAKATAQRAGDTTSVACPEPRIAELCVELDASSSVDSAAGSLTFHWLMGDGTTLTGTKVSHCYAARRLYTVQLDVVDEKTGEVRTAEKILPIDFTQEIVLNFSATPAVIHPGQPIVFDAVDSQLPLCENVVVLWDFRDGAVANGRRVEHYFRRPGQYPVRMALRGNGPGSCPDSHCVSRIITVTVAP
ncbi:PKD domain-containing protein [Hymenobacter sediminicola]|uniref:PKD domain-containing protein n=1 Tax=Hymenobacter sediminicola TaxID=2761579 RepID=A0A7G7W9J8_9BACT|nr:PKD domain-containing protein [Hymenobacter sediminicola]QNH63041.1 PKD domain-containing protein [Hymenobacter sediminicola]